MCPSEAKGRIDKKEASAHLGEQRSKLFDMGERDSLQRWSRTLDETPPMYQPIADVACEVGKTILPVGRCLTRNASRGEVAK